jgi:hypothetical protein
VGMCLFISSKVLSRRSLSSNGRVASWVPSFFHYVMLVIACPYDGLNIEYINTTLHYATRLA